MKLTEEGLALIRSFEGFRGTAYRCAAGVLTIGYDAEKDRKHFHVTESGIVVIPKGMRIEGRS